MFVHQAIDDAHELQNAFIRVRTRRNRRLDEETAPLSVISDQLQTTVGRALAAHNVDVATDALQFDEALGLRRLGELSHILAWNFDIEENHLQ